MNVRVLVERLHLLGQHRHELRIERVEHLRPVEFDDAHVAVGLVQDERFV
jgi:hypothetical protein